MGAAEEDFGGRYGFPGFHRVFASTICLEVFLWGQKSSPNEFLSVVVLHPAAKKGPAKGVWQKRDEKNDRSIRKSDQKVTERVPKAEKSDRTPFADLLFSGTLSGKFQGVPKVCARLHANFGEPWRSLANFGEPTTPYSQEPPWHSPEFRRRSPAFTRVPVKVRSVLGWPSECAQPWVVHALLCLAAKKRQQRRTAGAATCNQDRTLKWRGTLLGRGPIALIVFSLTEAPLPNPTQHPETDPKQTRNRPETDPNLATGKYGCTEVRVYPTECGEQLGRDPSKIGSSKFLVLKSFSGEGTRWNSSLLVSLTLWDTPVLFTPPLPLPLQTHPKRTQIDPKWTEIKLSGVGRPGGLSGWGGALGVVREKENHYCPPRKDYPPEIDFLN